MAAVSSTLRAELNGAETGGVPIFNLTAADNTVLNGDGTRTETVTETDAWVLRRKASG